MVFKNLSRPVATLLAFVGSFGVSVPAGAAIGFLVTVLWFNNTRADGVAVFFIAAIAGGVFVSVVVFASIVSRHHVPSRAVVLLPAGLWLIVAIQSTWRTCKGAFITWQNFVWILQSGDQRNYELRWLFRGWLAIALSLGAALFAARLIVP